ncbi:MAG TPA: SLC13 family permease [Vicinamibacterales bacterium]|jgi:hypothetical protein
MTIPADDPRAHATPPAIVMLSSRRFLLACAVTAAAILLAGHVIAMPVGLLAAEVLATILALFALGSFRYQLHKNALTYGMLLVIVATFCRLRTSAWHEELAAIGWSHWLQRHLFSFSGLDDLLHADTMLFILGLTLFVAVMAQTRLLEGVTYVLLRRYRGAIEPTVIAVTAAVAVASGIFGGVSMISLTIRTQVIILMLASVPIAQTRFAIMLCTAVTTICGVFSAYGEPPNLIMKANLAPHLGNDFFLFYCGPVAVVSYLMVAWQLRRKLRGRRIDLAEMDIIDANVADVRFLQATRHGEVLTPIELIEQHVDALGDAVEGLLNRVRHGESIGIALVREAVPEPIRRQLLGHFVSEDLADALDRHYVLAAAGDREGALRAERVVDTVVDDLGIRRRSAQRFGGLAIIPFAVVLVLHGLEPRVPLFVSSFVAFAFALPAIADIPRMRALAWREARSEYAEYYFLFPLFISITLLTAAGFFSTIEATVQHGATVLGAAPVALAQFTGSTFLSAILDNNIVADFASRGLHGLDLHLVQLFAMSQIAGYALGGCWTHIGSAQSVVAYAFIQREVDTHFTPVGWIKEITPAILQIFGAIAALICVESVVLRWWHG